MPVSVEPLAPKEAIASWKDKAPISSDDYKDLDAKARSRAFAVSGLAKSDQVNAIHSAIGKALENGETLAQFKGRIGDIIKEQGWTGQKAWRVENIFRTNVQSAYMAGRYQQMKRVAKTRPYWKYSAVRDRRTRPEHSALHDLVYPHDHPFWSQFYPPNGFACRCTVTTLSARQVKSRGVDVQSKMPGTMRVVDPTTGMETFVTPIPDKGWATNVGEDWLSGLTPKQHDGDLKDISKACLCRSGDHADDVCRPPLVSINPRHIRKIKKTDILPKGLPSEDYVRAFLKEFGIDDLNGRKVHRLPGAIPVVISKDFFIKDKATGQGWKVKKEGREQFLKLLARTILDPFEVWETSVLIKGRERPCLNLLRLFANGDGKIGGYAVFHLINGRTWHGATTYTPKLGKSDKGLMEYLEKKRNGRLLYREELK